MKATSAWTAAALLSACPATAVELPSDVAFVQVYDARTGAWERGTVGDLEVGDEVLHEGHLLRVTSDGVEDRGFAEVAQLSRTDATWTVDGVVSVPDAQDWVLVLGDADDAGHWRLQDLSVGERFAFGGRVYETGVLDGELAVRATEQVVAEVVQTFKRMVVDEVIDLQVAFPDGETAVITGTHEHPFYVPAVDLYVPLGELEAGTVLRTDLRGEAVVVELNRREGEFEVFNIEVAEAHNYLVRGAGFEGPGVLVHNKPMRRNVYKQAGYHHRQSRGGSQGGKSRAPTNGQDALDNSVQVKETSTRRVGYDDRTGEVAIFDETSSGVFHGHVREWGELSQQQQSVLRKEFGFDKKGNPPD